MLSSVSRRTFATSREWNLARRVALLIAPPSMDLEIVEGFQAGEALVERLARRRTEPRDLPRANRIAAGAAHAQGEEHRIARPAAGGCDPELLELSLALLTHPIGRPRRGEGVGDLDVLVAGRPQGVGDVGAHLVDGGAPGIRGGEDDVDSVLAHARLP